ncbi:MAG: isoprenylcysteine carboxylmethyltransferase family protein [Candidatus Thorarchaeota archaeon]
MSVTDMLNLALRIIYLLLWLFYLLSRLIPSRGLPSLETSKTDRRAALKEEGWYILITIAISWYGNLIVAALYILDPPWMLWSYMYLPAEIRILGVISAAILIPYTYWVGKTLAENYSDRLQIQEEQTLITTGPYGRIRHPIYASAIYFLGALILVSDNFLFLILLILIIPGIYRRMKKEEGMMIDQFGDEYLDYMNRTGRVFPKV